MLIDAHVHLWDVSREPYAWLKSWPAWDQTHDLAAFDAARHDVAVDRIVFVECTGAMEDAAARREVAWVEQLARQDARLQGIVAHASLEKGTGAREHLAWLAERPLVKGVRRLIQDEPDPAFCLQPAFVTGVQMLADFNLPFDVCVRHHQLPSVIDLVRCCPEVTFVLDHLGKPPIREGRLDPWRQHLRTLAGLPNVVCKISGVLTEADLERWTPADVTPYIAFALDQFGPHRTLFGSDWPVLNRAGTYPAWVRLLREIARAYPQAAQDALFGATAVRVYGLREH